MPESNTKLNRIFQYTFIGFAALVLLYVAQPLFIPLFYGLFIAIVLYPLCHWLQLHYFSRSAAIAAGLGLVAVLFILLLLLVQAQLGAFRNDLPELKERITPALGSLKRWIAENAGISVAAQNEWWHNALKKMSDNPQALLSGTLNKTFSAVFTLLLVPVFAALFLYNRQQFVLFIEESAGKKNKEHTRYILRQTIHTYFNFIKGMALVYIIVGVLNSIGLLALGIRHAILFGFLTAVMTIIPYAGLFISALLPITVAWITKDSIWYPAGVVAVFTFVQYLEANVIFPRVVGTQLNISTWATLVAIIGGGILWGVNGMILFIPLTGILKIISDHAPGWEAVNMLLRRNNFH